MAYTKHASHALKDWTRLPLRHTCVQAWQRSHVEELSWLLQVPATKSLPSFSLAQNPLACTPLHACGSLTSLDGRTSRQCKSTWWKSTGEGKHRWCLLRDLWGLVVCWVWDIHASLDVQMPADSLSLHAQCSPNFEQPGTMRTCLGLNTVNRRLLRPVDKDCETGTYCVSRAERVSIRTHTHTHTHTHTIWPHSARCVVNSRLTMIPHDVS